LQDFTNAGIIKLMQKIDLKRSPCDCEEYEPEDKKSQKAEKVP
jgi:hypothetical protein